jgi:hypothetical protein
MPDVFEVFADACKDQEMVFVQFLEPLLDDPALPENLRRDGLMTMVQGNEVSIDDKQLRIRVGVVKDEGFEASVIRVIDRDWVRRISLIGETRPDTAAFINDRVKA